MQGNHRHLIVEVDDRAALSRGMQGLLETPTELVRAIRYVLGNAARHFGTGGADPFSSGALPAGAPALSSPRGWLLRRGVRRVAPELVLRW